MNILDLLRRTIQLQFPEITETEMQIRLDLAYELLKEMIR